MRKTSGEIIKGMKLHGQTTLSSGLVVDKDSLPIETSGAVEEVICWIGIIRSDVQNARIASILERIQSDLYGLSSAIKSPPQRLCSQEQVRRVRNFIEEITASRDKGETESIFGGTKDAAFANTAWAICRRAERRLSSLTQMEQGAEGVSRDIYEEHYGLAYLNALSDLLYLIASGASQICKSEETAVSFNQGETGSKSLASESPQVIGTSSSEKGDEVRRKIDRKTKPLGALGRIEDLAAQISYVTGSLEPQMRSCELTIFAGDHGIVEEDVSAYPQIVTRQMLLNFLGGNAAANVFARSVGASLRVVDSGVAGNPLGHPKLISRRIGAGTRNFLHEPAMSPTKCEAALSAGRKLGSDGSWDAVCFGEMGIGNTSAATLLAHKVLGIPLDTLVGRGTGLDDAGVEHKLRILKRAAGRTAELLAAREALTEFGGFEIAMMAGAMLGAAAANRVVIVDGFIAGAAALVAIAEVPETRKALVFSHRSAERGHAAMLAQLGAEPLFDLGMRLGEGTGALLAWPLLQAAAAMLTEMSSFEAAGVDGPA